MRCHYVPLLMPHTLDGFVCADTPSPFPIPPFTAFHRLPASSLTSLTCSYLHSATCILQRTAGAPRCASGGERRSAELLCLYPSLSLCDFSFSFFSSSMLCVCVRVFARLFPFLGCLLPTVADSLFFIFFSSFLCLAVCFLCRAGAHTCAHTHTRVTVRCASHLSLLSSRDVL